MTQHAIQPYFGVDRLPPYVSSIDNIRQSLGLPLIRDKRLKDALEEWFDSCAERIAFFSNSEHLHRLLETFRSYGDALELIFCHLAWQEGEESELSFYDTLKEPETRITYGFDVSWPTCNHSAIIQPGLVPTSDNWRGLLNKYSLLDRYEDARRLREEYLKVYPYPPFHIYLVHGME